MERGGGGEARGAAVRTPAPAAAGRDSRESIAGFAGDWQEGPVILVSTAQARAPDAARARAGLGQAGASASAVAAAAACGRVAGRRHSHRCHCHRSCHPPATCARSLAEKNARAELGSSSRRSRRPRPRAGKGKRTPAPGGARRDRRPGGTAGGTSQSRSRPRSQSLIPARIGVGAHRGRRAAGARRRTRHARAAAPGRPPAWRGGAPDLGAARAPPAPFDAFFAFSLVCCRPGPWGFSRDRALCCLPARVRAAAGSGLDACLAPCLRDRAAGGVTVRQSLPLASGLGPAAVFARCGQGGRGARGWGYFLLTHGSERGEYPPGRALRSLHVRGGRARVRARVAAPVHTEPRCPGGSASSGRAGVGRAPS